MSWPPIGIASCSVLHYLLGPAWLQTGTPSGSVTCTYWVLHGFRQVHHQVLLHVLTGSCMASDRYTIRFCLVDWFFSEWVTLRWQADEVLSADSWKQTNNTDSRRLSVKLTWNKNDICCKYFSVHRRLKCNVWKPDTGKVCRNSWQTHFTWISLFYYVMILL